MASERPRRIGDYQLLARLGAGGMGEVFRAHDPHLRRDVALKLLRDDVADDPERRARMVNEARAAASLNHPNICTIYQVGEADGQHYLAMELVEGRPLSARLSGQRLSTGEAMRIASQLAEAVGHAHDRGIVHRDLKGANVMVTPEGRVKVLDFGLAKRISPETVSEFTMTQTAAPVTSPFAILGTLPYMAPEQLRGQPADARSDVWALGIILFEMAVGQRPFDGTTSFETSAAILHTPHPPLPDEVPPALAGVIARCLEKAPELRYQRGGEVHAALEAVQGEERLPIARPKAASRLPTPRAAALVVAVLVAAAGIAWWTLASRQQPQATEPGARIRSVAVLPLENRSGDPGQEYFVAGMHEALITDLARIGLQKVIAKASADAFKDSKKPLREIARELGVAGLITGSVIRANNRIQITAQLVDAQTDAVVWANRYERNAGDVASLQNDVVGAIARELQVTLTPEQSARLAIARPVNAAAHDGYLKGRALLAAFNNSAFDPERFRAVVNQLEQATRLDPSYAPPHAALSLVYLTASQTSMLPPNQTFPKAKAAALQAVALDDNLADAHAALGEVNTWYDWDWAAADREIQRALALNPDSTDAVRAWEVFLTLIVGRGDEGRQASQRLLSLDPLNPFSRVQPIWQAFFSRRYDESIAHGHQLRELYPGNIMAPFLLAGNYAVKRMPTEVGDECGKVLAMIGDNYAMQLIGQCAWAYATVARTADARALLERLEKRPAGVWLDPVVMGNVYGALGHRDRALEWLQKGLAERAPNMIYLKASPINDSVRDDPRFQALLRQMNFPS